MGNKQSPQIDINYIERFYNNNKEALSIAETAIKEIQKLETNSYIPAGAGSLGWRERNSGVRTLGVGISAEFIQKGYINLRGKQIECPEQLAVIAQVYRDPRFETLRFIYTKEDVIVGHEGITSKLPAAAVAFLDQPNRENFKNEDEFFQKVKSVQVRFFMNMLNRMERMNADGYYLLHNHPSALCVKPSQEDINVSYVYKNSLPGFKGHVIIDTNQYSFIDENLKVSVNLLNLGEDKLLEPSIPHPLLGESIDSSNKLASFAKAMQIEEKYSVVLYMNAKNKIRAIQEVPDGLFNHEKECVDFLRGRMTEFGAQKAFVVTRSQHVKDIASGMVEKGYLLDAIISNKDYSVTSVRESGVNPSGYQDVYWMGRSMSRGVKVSEIDTRNYSSNKNSNLNAIKTNSNRELIHEVGI